METFLSLGWGVRITSPTCKQVGEAEMALKLFFHLCGEKNVTWVMQLEVLCVPYKFKNGLMKFFLSISLFSLIYTYDFFILT